MDKLKVFLLFFLETSYFREWLLSTLTIIGFMLLCRRAFQGQLRTGAPPGVGALIIVAILFVSLNFRATPTGDEPHYLIMAQSFLRDGDFDLRNNYENKDYLEYYPDTIPDPHAVVVDDHWYPVHGIGLPILVAPFFAAGGRPAVIGFLILCTVAGLGVLWFLMRQAGFQPRTTSAVTLVAGFTLPLVSLSGQIFPEVPAFLLVTLALQAMIMPVLAGWGLLRFLLSLILLPWLHPKYVALASALLLSAALIHRRRSIPMLVTAIGLLLASLTGLAVLSYQWYRVPLPGAPIVMPQPSLERNWITPLVGHFFVAPWIGLFGALFDQQSGLFFASPIYVLAIPGIILLWRRARNLAIVCGLVFASVYLPAGSFGVWYGGFSSPARLLTPVIPILTLGLASVLDSGGHQRWKLFAGLAIPSFLHAYLMTALPSFTRYGDVVTQHNFFVRLFERILGLDLTLLFPSFRNPEPITWLTTVVYVLVVIILSVVSVRQNVIQLPIGLELSHD